MTDHSDLLLVRQADKTAAERARWAAVLGPRQRAEDALQTCHGCAGSGEGLNEGSTCQHCRGSGETTQGE